MISSVGLEVMNSTSPELSLKPVAKGQRTKKTVARSLNSVVKVGNSPKRVGDFFGSDSDKFGEVILGQTTTGKSENVPLKKRRHLLRSPSPHPWASSLLNQDFTPTRTLPSPHLEDHVQLQYPSRSSGDFSGIELLAAAASMGDDAIVDADKKDILPEDSSIQKNSCASGAATMSEQGLKNNESVNSLSNIDVLGGNVDAQDKISSATPQSLSTSPYDDRMPKVSREHWDLNTPMDAWGEPEDDFIVGDTLEYVNEERHLEKHFGDDAASTPTGTTDQPSSLEGDENKSTVVPVDGICSESPHLKENLREPLNSICSHIGRDDSCQSHEKNHAIGNSTQALNFDSEMKTSNQAKSSDAIVSNLCYDSSMLMSEEKNNATSASTAMIQNGDCSSNISERERNAALGGSHTGTNEVNAHGTAASESAIAVLKDTEISQKTSELLGTFTEDAQPVASTDSNKEIDEAFLSNSTMTDCKHHSELSESDIKHDGDTNLSKEESMKTMMADTCKSFRSGMQCDEPSIARKSDVVLDVQHNSDVSQKIHVGMVDGDDLTGFQEGYDSPYEDGELRGSCLYSWEDNEMENECVDYESDGRNGDGSDADADAPNYYHESEIVEGGSEGSHGSQRSLTLKISVDSKSKSGAVKNSLKKHVIKDEPDNTEMAGKASNDGSGCTVEQGMDMVMEENDGIKRLQLLDHKDAVNVRVTNMDGYASKGGKGKLQSRIEGQSSADANDGMDAIFIQQSRSHRLAGSDPRPEREISPDRYLGRYRSTALGERDVVNQWTSWGTRRRYPTKYQGGEGRNFTRPRCKTGESTSKIDGADYHEPRQTNYLPKSLHRPVMRRSPVERDDYFGVGRRIPLTRGAGSYQGRGHYSQRPGRDFAEDFEPLSEDAGVSIRVPRYVSRREEHSFSPSSGRHMHMTMPRRRTRSRSRTRSPPPRAWHPQKERVMGAGRLSRSPNFRSEGRMERMRMSFSKNTFSSDYGEGFSSPSRGRFSPQRNCRWVEERNFADNHIRRRRSPPPVGVFRHNQRFDGVGPSGRLKTDEYNNFRPAMRPGRFSFVANNGGGREFKLESNYDDRRRDDSSEMGRRVVHIDDAGNMRRFRHNTGGGGDGFEAKNLTSEDISQTRGVTAAEQQQQQGKREDKKAYKNLT